MRKRTNDPHIMPAPAAYVLNYQQLAAILSTVDVLQLVEELSEEIGKTYSDRKLRRISPRVGWPHNPDTLEIMGCRSDDYSCIKIISSNPSSAGPSEPTVTGTMICTSVGNDQARLVCDAALLTSLRTAVSTGFVMRKIVPRVNTLGVIGAGLEGTTHGLILPLMLPSITTVVITDIDKSRAATAAAELQSLMEHVVGVRDRTSLPTFEDAGDSVRSAARCSAVVTATYGTSAAISKRAWLAETAFIAAVGADLEGKRELDTSIYDAAKFVADDLAQCLFEGELQHTYRRLDIDRDKVESHRGSLLDGRVTSVADLLDHRAMSRFEEINEYPVVVYDSTGFAGQDLAIARVILRILEAMSVKGEEWNPRVPHSLISLMNSALAAREPSLPLASSE